MNVDQVRRQPGRSSSYINLIWMAFFLSGIAGISYELIWVRYIGRFTGVSTAAIAATVSLFLCGLALGALLGGRVFNHVRRPLRAYAVLEVAIGAVAACVPFIVYLTESMLAQLQQYGNSLTVALAASAVVLLPPTTLLGATFPGMAAAVRHLNNPVHSTGLFYGLNTLGGVMGCVLVPFVLLPWVGHTSANWIMVSINITVALVVIIVYRHIYQRSEPAHADSRAVTESAVAKTLSGGQGDAASGDLIPAIQGPALPLSAAAVASFASGLFAIGIEVLWTRALALSFPSSVYVFAIVLAAYLTGIGLGSVTMPSVCRRYQPKHVLLVLYLVIALGAFITLPLFPFLTDKVFSLVQTGILPGWEGYISTAGIVTFGIMLPATLAMGAALPLLIGIATPPHEESRVAGRVYALNVIGGVAGSFAATFIIMPWVGLSEAIMLLALGYVALPLILLRYIHVGRSMQAAAVMLLVIGIGVTLLGWHPDINPDKAPRGEKILFHKDAPSATISILEESPSVRALMINKFYGHNRTSRASVRLHYTLGHLSMLLHPAPERALLVGFATGNTLAAMAEHPVEELDCVELHPLLFELAPFFRHVNHGVWQDPKVRLIGGDGRRYLLGPGDKYDVIVGELYFPRNPGVGALYSLEHFQAARRRLTQDGRFIAWLPLWQLSTAEAGSIIRTFLQIFPHGKGWLLIDSDRPVLGLVGGKRDFQNPPGVRPQLQERLTASMSNTYSDVSAILSVPVFPMLTNERLRIWADRQPINSLEYPFIEFSAPRNTLRYALQGASPARKNLAYIRELQGYDTFAKGEF